MAAALAPLPLNVPYRCPVNAPCGRCCVIGFAVGPVSSVLPERVPNDGPAKAPCGRCWVVATDQTTVNVSVVSGAVVQAPVASVKVGVLPLVCDTMTAA